MKLSFASNETIGVDIEFRFMKQDEMASTLSIADLRKELDLSLEAFGERIGLASKGNVSVIERDNRCSPTVALAIEALSGGRINASDLNDVVAAARRPRPSVALCGVCDLRADDPKVQSCTDTGCPLVGREAA